MITTLTPEQEAEIPIYIQKWLDMAKKPTDRNAATKAVKAIYKAMGEDEPLVVFGQSPYSTAVMAAMAKKGVQLRDQLNGQLRDQLQLGDQLYGQLHNQLYVQLYGQFYDQLRDQLQLGGQLRDQLNGQLRDQLYGQLRDQLYGQLRDLNNDWYLIIWLQSWAGWYDYAKHVGVKFDKVKYGLFMDFVSNVGFIIPYKGIAFVSESPTRIVWNDAKLLSYDHGPAVEYADGYGMYMLDGVRFEKNEWEKIVNQEYTLESLGKAEMGSDKSAIALKYAKPDVLLEGIKARLIHTGIKGTRLYQVDNFMDTGKTEYCIRMKHPSIEREYIEWVHPDTGKQGDADVAQATAFGVPLEDYLLAVEA